MRNLVLSSVSDIRIRNQGAVTATCVDLDEDVLYATTETVTPDGEVQVEVVRVGDADTHSSVTMFTATAAASGPQVVSLHVLPDSHSIVAIMRNGDITNIPLDEEAPMAEVEGTVEPGICAASWNPDETLVALITDEDKLILMTSTFDVISEGKIQTEDFGEDAPINVGWGSKQTQFHGSLGKSAAQAGPATVVSTSTDDDLRPRISWRGDGSLFAISSLSITQSPPDSPPIRRRTLRVYNRQGALQSTSEAVPGLEHPLSWRPSGNLIASTQRFGFEGGGAGRPERHDIVFFERNGLRHGEFGLTLGGPPDSRVGQGPPKDTGERRWGHKVRELCWSPDSNVLAVWIERDEYDSVQLWTTGNYHWYLKQEIQTPKDVRLTSVQWHPESPLNLVLTTPNLIMRRVYAWDTFTSLTGPPDDTGTVAVIDGSQLLLTPFRIQNVPPPMSSHKLALQPALGPPVHVAFGHIGDVMGVLYASGLVELWDLHTRTTVGRGKPMAPEKIASGELSGGRDWRQIVVVQGGAPTTVYCLGTVDDGRDITITTDLKAETRSAVAPGRHGRLLSSGSAATWQAADGKLYDVPKTGDTFTPIGSFPEFCFVASRSQDPSIHIGLARSGKLYASNSESPGPQTVATNATSFAVASGFLVFTTTAHEAVFAPLADLVTDATSDDLTKKSTEWEKRRVERGSRIVVAVPSAMNLVLQMPRGNLETISPRPFVMAVVRQDLDRGEYRKAFFSCRRNRIDLNVLVTHNFERFLNDVPAFLDQIPEVDHINLFLTAIGRGSLDKDVVTRICDAVRVELEKRGLARYVNSILTAHIMRSPPDHEAALGLLLRLKESDPALVEDAVKYIIFLVDADSLFDTALGMYDFSLVLVIAQHAQKDPREYLPFLRELRALDTYYQRFRIDDHLRRYSSALKNLSLAGTERFDEAIAYVERYQLYDDALRIWKGTDRYNTILTVYGDWLFERRELRDAAAAFLEAGGDAKAMQAMEKALDWENLFDLALRNKLEDTVLVDMAYRVAEGLVAKKKYADAGRVLLDYAHDVREAVIALVQGNLFSAARRIIALHSRPELLEDIVHPGALESRAQIEDDIGEMREQIRKQVNRVRELRVKKVEEPDAFYGEEANLHNVDVMTDVSMPATAFTRYTVAPSMSSKASKKTSRSRRKAERKAGRKGTVEEEEYLLTSVGKLVARFNATLDETRALLPHLYQLSPEHRAEGAELQADVAAFEVELKSAVEEIWTKPAEGEGVGIGVGVEENFGHWQGNTEFGQRNTEFGQGNTERSVLEQMQMHQKPNPVDKVPKPEFSREEWRLKLYDLL
ncbi:IkappaB kinase complex, IKAP component [Schizophyllum commune H4-8]|uniref:IkappaB kinase complex, IKAP component n=1 Tax=Schizophyllum commune (strain H4-8 / FGSC 9210) TaxID=578458 RepID=UPI002160EBD5|nr:IkappaB kinase complex, IKAP component [Schizophyllum commune H4-8]KAI5890064.1 IkappaB kinase complex, IKAP component [Schizophyllum commune H4-8]